jgi:hypothetical protein
MDSITLPERSRHEAAGRPIRRRRSAAHSPVVVAPIDIPEDAEGRVEIFAVRAPEDAPEAVPAAPAFGSAPLAAERAGWTEELLGLRSGWVAVLILAALLAALFVVGDFLTH